jgi:TolA-binding protein
MMSCCFFSYILSITLALSWVSESFAQIERKNERAAVDVEQRNRPGDDKKKEKTQNRPSISSAEIYGAAVEKKLIQGINQTIAYLNKTAAGLPKKSEPRYEMRDRVLNLHLEQAVYVAGEEQRRYDQAWENWDQRGRRGAEPKLNNNESRKHWNLVSRVGAEILEEYPKAKNADQINFNQALALQFLGKEQAAARAYSNLIKKYPNSTVAGDAFFSLGDYHFERNDFRNAINNFKQALKYRRSKRYGWALFKLGWSYFNLGRYPQAEDFWKKTVSYSNRTKESGGVRLKEEAMRDLVLVFAELRKEDHAISYFRSNQGERFIGPFLILLAETFTDQGQFDRSIKVWKRLQSILPNGIESSNAQKEIIVLNFELQRMKVLWVELERYVKNYGEKSSWATRVDKNVAAEVALDTKDSLLYHAKIIHKNAQKNDSSAGLSQAKIGYLLFLKYFPNAREVAEVKFNLADIEYFQKNYRRSGQYYLEIALAGKNRAVIFSTQGKPTNIHLDSAKFMLDSFNRDFEPEFKVLIKNKPDFSKPARPLSVKAKNFIQACGYYSKWYPQDKKSIKTCDTFVTEIYFRSNDKKIALTQLWMLATKYPGSKEGVDAVENIIPIYKDDKAGRIVAVNKLLEIPAYQRGEIGKKLRELRRSDEIAAIEMEKSKSKRGDLWAERAKKYPNDKDADSFLFNAAADYLESGEVTKAIGAYAMIVSNYPKSKRANDSLLQLGKLNDRRQDYNTAAVHYLNYYLRNPKEKEAPAALQRSCDLQIAMGASTALQTCNMLAKAAASEGKVAIAKLIQNTWRSKNYDQMTQLINNHYLNKFKLTPNETVIASYKIYSAYGGRGGLASQAGQTIAGLQGNSSVDGEALRYIGELAFARANVVMPNFMKIKLQGGTVETLNQSIQQKSQALAEVEKTYGQVLATKDSFWGIAALHQIGFAYEDVANQLANPPGITGAKIEDVQKQLAPLAADATKSAKNFYQQAADLVKKFSVYNTWTPRVNEAISRMEKRPLKFQDLVVSPDFIGSEVPYEVGSAVYTGGG